MGTLTLHHNQHQAQNGLSYSISDCNNKPKIKQTNRKETQKLQGVFLKYQASGHFQIWHGIGIWTHWKHLMTALTLLSQVLFVLTNRFGEAGQCSEGHARTPRTIMFVNNKQDHTLLSMDMGNHCRYYDSWHSITLSYLDIFLKLCLFYISVYQFQAFLGLYFPMIIFN